MISKWEDTVMSDTFKRQFRYILTKPSQDVSRWDIDGLLQTQAEITWEVASKAGIRVIGEWLKGRCSKTHCLGNLPLGYQFEIDSLSMNALLRGEIPEEVKDEVQGFKDSSDSMW